MLRWTTCLPILVLAACLLSGQNAHSAPKTIVVLGDSISAEYGLPRDTGWVALLRQRCQQQGIDVNIVNASVSGDTTAGGNSRLPATLASHKPNLLLIELGGNDGLRGLSLQDTESNLRNMIRQAKTVGAQVMLLGMRLPPNYGKRYTDQFFALYGKLAKEEKTALVPFLFEGMADQPQWFQADRIHPNQAAQPLLLNNVWPVLAPSLPKASVQGRKAK